MKIVPIMYYRDLYTLFKKIKIVIKLSTELRLESFLENNDLLLFSDFKLNKTKSYAR